jgi:deazaflavin-dependent oxidoreductase (nitroreductase family)
VSSLAASDEPFCYITTTGRRTGRPHTIEIWFAAYGVTLYVLSGGETDWVRNLRAASTATVRLGSLQYEARARFPEPGTDEDERARRLVLEKYDPTGADRLGGWARSALPVAFDLDSHRPHAPSGVTERAPDSDG